MADSHDPEPPVDSSNAPADLGPPSLPPPPEDNPPEKPSHPLEEDDSASPHASKKRRTESGNAGDAGDEEIPPPSHPAGEGDQPPGNSIEQELASALGSGAVEPVERNEEGGHDANDTNGDPNDEPGNDNVQIKTEGSVEGAAPDTVTELDPDMATVISNIMNHAERIDEQCALGQHNITDAIGQSGPQNMMLAKANSHLKSQSLPILDNLSTQILSLLAKSSYQDITSLVSEPESENGQAYATMRSLFDHTKKVYSTNNSFLSAPGLGLTEPAQVDIIRKANLASFVSSIFGTQEIGFSELNDNFLDIFVPEGGRLLKIQGALFLELKTQAYIASMNSKDCSRTELLYNLFPDSLEQGMLDRRPGTRQLAPSEIDFVNRAKSRRDILLGEINNEEAVKSLPDKYHWEDFLRDLSSYVTKNFETLSHPQTKRTIIKGHQSSSSNGDVQESSNAPLQGQFSVAQPAPDVPVDKNMHGDLVARAARAAQIALQGHGMRRSQQPQPGQQPPPPSQPVQLPQHDGSHQASEQTPQTQRGHHRSPAPSYQQHPPGQITFHQNPLQTNFQQYNPTPAAGPSRADTLAANHGYMPGIPHYSQSQPTQVLYERARMAASAKSSPSSRKSGLPSQRRPWTTEEENALMAGLDRVKGPHWSQILAMFGPGGTISEALKDRNQVQLKDKARNLKLFFLKSGIEVPYYLKFVTGELKTRAPAQAAKREARERQKKQGEEDKAHVEGIKGMMALAGAHSQPVPMTPGTEGMSASPSVPPDTGSQPTFDQTAEQNLMQTLGQEVHGEQFGQTQNAEQGMQMG